MSLKWLNMLAYDQVVQQCDHMIWFHMIHFVTKRIMVPLPWIQDV